MSLDTIREMTAEACSEPDLKKRLALLDELDGLVQDEWWATLKKAFPDTCDPLGAYHDDEEEA